MLKQPLKEEKWLREWVKKPHKGRSFGGYNLTFLWKKSASFNSTEQILVTILKVTLEIPNHDLLPIRNRISENPRVNQ